jgi:hypothetical protein
VKSFRSLVVLKRPQDELWAIMRDHLPQIAPSVADIEEVRELERTSDDGVVRIVNRWQVRANVPQAIRSMLKLDELAWIDRNTWNEATRVCAWSIEPCFLTDHIVCAGTTSFAPAMGGQGARVTFEGTLELKPGFLPLGGLEKLVTGFVESIATTIIPRNLRAVVEAAANYRA